MRAGVQYVVINLIGSSVFLMALGLIYAATGTLNMADFARMIPLVDADNHPMLYTGVMLLVIVFGLKSALVPLQFWLPGTYSNAAGPVAALFAILTKVGAYSMMRVFLLSFGESAGERAFFLGPWLMPAAGVTLLLGMLGVVASRSLSQQASFAALASMGTLFLAIATFTPKSQSAAMYYMLHSTLAMAALFLLIDAVVIRRPGYGDALINAPKFRNMGFIAAMYFVAAIAVLGLPPLSGFVGKLLVLDAVTSNSHWGWLWGIILGSSVLGLIGFAHSGSIVFWKSLQMDEVLEPQTVLDDLEVGKKFCEVSYSGKPISVNLSLPMVSVGAILGSLVLLTGFSGLVLQYLDATAAQLYSPQEYITSVLGEGVPQIVKPTTAKGGH